MPIDTISSATTVSQASQSRTTLAANFDTFLTLLTAQLQNQDPLSPMDSNEFTQQLVAYSQVEQQITTNEQLESLLVQNRAASAGAALSYLGRQAIMASPTTALADGEAAWTYTLAEQSEAVRLEVRDSRNVTIYSANGEREQGSHDFVWDGRMNNGQPAPEGVYTLSIVARDRNDARIDATITTQQRIVGLDLAAANPQVVTASGAYDLSTIRAILND